MLTKNQETIFNAERDAKRELQVQIEQIIGKLNSLGFDLSVRACFMDRETSFKSNMPIL